VIGAQREGIGQRGSRRLLAILGPTASGKSSLALSIAQRVGGEIVNCDALQMTRFLNIGTAKPSHEERALVPHHFFDIINPDESYSAGAYMKDARRVCQEIATRGLVPIVVGGSGLYLRVLLEGIFEGPEKSSEIRSRLHEISERMGSSHLYKMLKRKDPDAAARIQTNDLMRVIRALEVAFVTGRTISELQMNRKALDGFNVLKVGINVPREDLYDRINRRVEWMFQSGLMEEVEAVLGMGYPSSCKGFEALGYRYAVSIVSGEMTPDRAIELTQRDTRRYAKRQLTWFRKERDVVWLTGPGEDPAATSRVMNLLEGMGG
jgi:tRNA dimethylallyltransferase